MAVISAKSLLDSDVVQCPYPFYNELRRERPIARLPACNAYFVPARFSSTGLARPVETIQYLDTFATRSPISIGVRAQSS